jgi:leucyl-tRNA synthetase
MELTNAFGNEKNISYDLWQKFLVIIAPFTPALSEELWKNFGNKKSIFENKNWPEYDKELIKKDLIKFVIQVNGKVREIIEVKVDISEEEAIDIAINNKKIKKWTQDKKIIKTIFVKNKLINIVIN